MLSKTISCPTRAGIALELQRCRDDFAAAGTVAGTQLRASQVATWLQDEDAEKHPKDPNRTALPQLNWQKNPAFAWWFMAGAFSIAVEMPRSAATTEFLASVVDMLEKHNRAAPEGFRGSIVRVASPFERARRLRAN